MNIEPRMIVVPQLRRFQRRVCGGQFYSDLLNMSFLYGCLMDFNALVLYNVNCI